MTKYLLKAVTLLIAFFFGVLLSYYACIRHFKAEIARLKPKVIQVIQYDTIAISNPVYIEKRIIERDTIKIPIENRRIERDTLFLPKEQKIYHDPNFDAWISGVSPKLDSIKFYNRIETRVSVQKEWRKVNYGLVAGYGIVKPTGRDISLGWYAGAGVCVKF